MGLKKPACPGVSLALNCWIITRSAQGRRIDDPVFYFAYGLLKIRVIKCNRSISGMRKRE